MDLRERVVAAVEGGMSQRQAAERSGVSIVSAVPWCARVRAMGLTPAEARLAEIIGRGHTLRAVAEMSGITYETARAHLRSVFAKLSIRRQADLVVLVTRLTANISS